MDKHHSLFKQTTVICQ